MKITLLLMASYVDMDTISKSWKENRACVSRLALKVEDLKSQGRSQTSEQDEASFERQRRQPLGGCGACPLPARKFWNLEAQKCSCKHFAWNFSSEKSIIGKCRSLPFLLSDTGAKLMAICILKHSNVVTRIITIKWIHQSSQRLHGFYTVDN